VQELSRTDWRLGATRRVKEARPSSGGRSRRCPRRRLRPLPCRAVLRRSDPFRSRTASLLACRMLLDQLECRSSAIRTTPCRRWRRWQGAERGSRGCPRRGRTSSSRPALDHRSLGSDAPAARSGSWDRCTRGMRPGHAGSSQGGGARGRRPAWRSLLGPQSDHGSAEALPEARWRGLTSASPADSVARS